MMQRKLENNREYGLDILRSVSMLMVILLHIISHGGLGAAYAPGSLGNRLVSLIEIAVYPAVDCFVLLSGYLLSALPFKLSRVVRVWLPAAFWSVMIQCIFFAINPDTISLGTVVYMLLPVLGEKYWFLNAYIVMLLISPALNQLLRSMDRWKMRGLLLVLLFVFCIAPVFAFGNDVFKTQNGYTFPWILALYLYGGYIRRYYPRCRQKWMPLIGYLLLVLCNMLWIELTTAVVPGMGVSGLFLKYTSIPVFGSAICLLQFFRNIKLKSKKCQRCIAGISPFVFAVYLIHDHPLIRAVLMHDRFAEMGQMLWLRALVNVLREVLGIFFLCVALDALRQWLFRVLRIDRGLDRISNRIESKVRTLLGD